MIASLLILLMALRNGSACRTTSLPCKDAIGAAIHIITSTLYQGPCFWKLVVGTDCFFFNNSKHHQTAPLYQLLLFLRRLTDPAQVGVLKVVVVFEAIAKRPVHGTMAKQHQTGQLQVRVLEVQA